MQRIHVAAHDGSHGTKTVSFPEESNPRGLAEIIFVPVPRRQDMHSLASEMYEHIPARTRRLSRTFILRAHRDEAFALTQPDSEAADLLEDRFPGAMFYVAHLLGESYEIAAIGNAVPLSVSVADGLLTSLRSAELQILSKQPTALLPSSERFHYVGPSGSHHKAFLRVGTALQSPQALDAACFWLTEWTRPNTIVLLDSPTLIALGLGLSQYLRDQEFLPTRFVRAIELLEESSVRAKNRLSSRLRRIKEIAGLETADALCVGSVVSSGRTLGYLREAAEDNGLSTRIVVLYGVPTPTGDVAVPLAPAPPGLEPLVPCGLCNDSAQRSTLIPISSTSLHIEVTGAVSRQKMTQQLALRGKAFVTRYAGTGAILAHQQETDGHRRHHAVSVDAAAMMKSDDFMREFSAKLVELAATVDLILCPEHEAAFKLAEFAETLLGITPIVRDENRLSSLSAEEQERIRASRSLLILDDVVISGDRLRGYRQYLFEIGRTSGDVHVLVALSRPTSEEDAKGIRELADEITKVDQSFHAIEEVLLPNWDESECPWCNEADAILGYEGLRGSGEFSEEFLRRYERLTEPFVGLKDDLFWSADGTPFPLGENSIFAPGNATQAELFFSVASVLQTMRSRGMLDEEYRPPVSKLLISQFWVRGRFYAPAITAAILRAARPHDLMPPQPTRSMEGGVTARLTEDGGHTINREFLWAIGQGKLPRTKGVDIVLDRDDQDDVCLDFLRTQIDRGAQTDASP